MKRLVHHETVWVGIVMVALGVWMAGCRSTAALRSIHAGRTEVYEAGVPNFDLEATPTLRDGRPGIDCDLGIPHASLVFLPEEDRFVAAAEVLFRLYDEKGQRVLRETVVQDTFRLDVYEATIDFHPVHLAHRMDVEPGTYLVEVHLTDLESEHEAVRRRLVDVMDPASPRPQMTAVRLSGRATEGTFEPLLALHLPARYDSLRAAVELYNTDRWPGVDVAMRLLRFEADTTVADRPYLFLNPNAYRRIRYDRADTLQHSRRHLDDPDAELTLWFDLPGLEPGIYRLEVTAEPEGGSASGAVLLRQRDFSVRRAAFPRIAILDEMIEALTYIARPREMDSLETAVTPEEKRRAFDAFWGRLVPNRQVAANLLKRYYSRVEEANLRFSSYKEGWRTDRGMIFIVFGPPIYVEDNLEQTIWRYSYDERDEVQAFVFRKRPLIESHGLFDTYILERDPVYERGWSRAVEAWRKGTAL